MKTNIVKFAVLLLACCVMLGCTPEGKNPGSIYGTVTDKSTGDCVPNAGVELMPKGLRTVTGTDGTFEFVDIDPGQYNLFITKVGYLDMKSNTIVVKSGEQARGDVQIEKLPASLQVLDNDGNVITELDFGGDAGVVSKTFKLYNRGDASFSFEIYKDVNWIENITPSEGIVPVNGNFPVILRINREELANGINTTSIIISSATVGGVELTVKATKGSVPTVITTTISNVTSTSAVIGGKVTSDGNIPVTQTGICYSTSQNPTISNHFVVGDHNTGDFTCNLTGLTPNTKYYVRAFATNGAGTAYGEQKNFTTNNSIPTFQYAGTTYYVHPEVGTMTWQSAMDYCDNLTYAGHSDWFLPNKDELNAMYVYRNSIGGFVMGGDGCHYWSSTEYTQGYSAWFHNFSNGGQGHESETTRKSVRPIRKDSGGGGGTTPTAPTVSTNEPTNVTNNSATCGGNVTSDGGANVIQRGVCYSTSPNPTTSSQVVTSGTGTGFFTCNLTGLSANTTYYVRAYAINSAGPGYGTQKTFTTGGGGTVPSAPTGVLAIVSGSRIKVSWNSVTNADEYLVYWSNDGNSYSYLVGTTTDTFIYDGEPYEDNYYKVKAKNSYGESPFSSPAYCHYSSGGGGGGGQTYTYTFESSTEDWHQIDADGDGNTWGRYYGTSHNNSSYCVGSESYINDVGPLFPDNYLYSPQRFEVSNGAKISFYVRAQDANYPAEHYGVAISTASTPAASSFVTIWEETLSAKSTTVRSEDVIRGNRGQGNWYLKTIDLSAYDGMSIWIAIRHFDCTDQYRINVDDITIVTGNRSSEGLKKGRK